MTEQQNQTAPYFFLNALCVGESLCGYKPLVGTSVPAIRVGCGVESDHTVQSIDRFFDSDKTDEPLSIQNFTSLVHTLKKPEILRQPYIIALNPAFDPDQARTARDRGAYLSSPLTMKYFKFPFLSFAQYATAKDEAQSPYSLSLFPAQLGNMCAFIVNNRDLLAPYFPEVSKTLPARKGFPLEKMLHHARTVFKIEL